MTLINVTDISSYLFCPRKVYLKKVKGIKEEASQKMILGLLKHKVFEKFSNNEENIVKEIEDNISEEEIENIYNNKLKEMVEEVANQNLKLLNSFRIKDEQLMEGVLNFMEKEISLRIESIKEGLNKGFLGKDLWENLKPKYRTEYKIVSENLGLKGKIDRVKLDEEIVPYEIKTKKDIYLSDKIQLAAYALLLENKFEKSIKKGIIESKAGREELEIDQQLKDKVFHIANEIKNFDEPPRIQSNFNKCRHCNLKDKCFNI